MQLSKQQVKYWLETMEKPGVRANINGAYIDIFENNTVVVTTDGYVLVALKENRLEQHVGKFIPRNNIINWYNQALTRDVFDDQMLVQMASTEDITYPVWQAKITDLDSDSVDSYSFRAEYAYNMEKIAGNHLTWNFNGKNQAMTAYDTVRNLYVIMPLKI